MRRRDRQAFAALGRQLDDRDAKIRELGDALQREWRNVGELSIKLTRAENAVEPLEREARRLREAGATLAKYLGDEPFVEAAAALDVLRPRTRSTAELIADVAGADLGLRAVRDAVPGASRHARGVVNY